MFNHFVCVDNYAFGVWYIASEQYTGLPLADAVLDAIARIDDQRSFIFEPLQQLGGALFAAHVDDNRLADVACAELLFAVDVDLATAFAQLLGHGVHNRGVIAYVVGGECPGSHYSGNFRSGHG